MPRTAAILSVLALGLNLAGQTPPAGEGAKGSKDAVATPSLSANQGINPDELIMVRATPYHPTLVRDPFSAPTDAEQTTRGDLVDDVGVKGIVISNGHAQAVVTDARGMIRTIPIGYKFRDGELVSINEKSVTFHQWDANSSNIKVFRTVVKTFKREEGKR